MTEKEKQPQKGKDERVSIPLDPEEALRGLLKVDPGTEPTEPIEKSREPALDDSP